MNTGKRSVFIEGDDGTRVEFPYHHHEFVRQWVKLKGIHTTQELIDFLEWQNIEHTVIPMHTPNVDAHARQVGGDHYKNLAVEPWKAMKSWLTREEFIGFLRGNIIKYHARANSGKGTREENLAKAAHYQQALTEYMEGTSQTTDTTN